MTRSQRRAAAHASTKAARKAGFPETEQSTAPNPIIDTAVLPAQEEPMSTISPAQLAANRSNAQKSTGPAGSEAKAKVSRNAVTHNLTGNQMIVRSEDVDRYETLIADYHQQFQPVGPEEIYLLQSIIDIRWRLASIPGYEAALLETCAAEMILQEPSLANNPKPMLDMQVHSHFEKKFRNLALQESRLARRREREMKELREMQATRKAAETKAREEAPPKAAPVPAANGIVSTTDQIDQYVAALNPEFREYLMDALLFVGIPTTETKEAAA